MPEGDTIFRAATVLRRVLSGQLVTGFHIDAPKVSAAIRQSLGFSLTEARGARLGSSSHRNRYSRNAYRGARTAADGSRFRPGCC